MKKHIWWVAVGILAIVGISIFVFQNYTRVTEPAISNSSTAPATSTNEQAVQTATSSVVDRGTTLKTYQNEQYGFEIGYPSNWSIGENKIFSTDKKIAASGNITGNEVTFTYTSPNCNFPRCDSVYPPKNLPIQIFPANPGDTTLTALARIKGNDVSLLNIKPLIIDGETFNYYKIWEYIVDASGSYFDEPVLLKNNKLYIVQCDTITGTQTIFDACNMTTAELNQLLSTFKFIN